MNGERNNVLTASRMGTLMRCPRQHYWQSEVGLRKAADGIALRIGSAWHRGIESRWKGLSYDDALAIAIPEGIELDAYNCSVIAAALAGYYDYYGPIERVGTLNPEQQFHFDLGEGFTLEGKIDGIGSLRDGRSVLIESKSTGESIKPESDYWLRLSFNMQVFQYVDAARRSGWDIAEVIYDVWRKPSIRPKMVDDLDKDGKKIVIDSNTKERIYLKAGKNKGEPRQTGDTEKGYVVKSHVETPDEFCDRLWKDTQARPDFYYARREVPILDGDLEQFNLQRLALARMILSFRENEKLVERPESAWPRNVSEQSCNFCSYKSFCLQNISININLPPDGFSVQPFNPELEKYEQDATSADGSNSSSAE